MLHGSVPPSKRRPGESLPISPYKSPGVFLKDAFLAGLHRTWSMLFPNLVHLITACIWERAGVYKQVPAREGGRCAAGTGQKQTLTSLFLH